MTKTEVINLLESNKNQRGIDSWVKMGGDPAHSYGLGLTQLKKLAKQVGKSHELALELWAMPIYDCKTVAALIDEPKMVSREQVESQTMELDGWLMAYTYYGNLVAKTSFQQELAADWIDEKDDLKRRCAWLCINNLAKSKKRPSDDYFGPLLERIGKELKGEENFVKEAMNNALFSIGTSSQPLHVRAVEIARDLGKVVVDYGANSCEALDCNKHLNSPRILKKMGVE